MVRNILRGGRRLQWLVMAIVFIFLQLVPLASLTNTVKAATYELASSNGVWTAVSGGSNKQGIGTNEVRWGYSTGMGQSGLRFDGSASQGFEENQKIVLGRLTHFNWPITNAADGATLAITLVFNNPAVAPNPSFTFNFAIDETPNQQPCASWHTGTIPCDDKITFPSSYPTQSFTIGDKLYTLKIEGFTSDSSGTNPVSEFITHEQQNNVAYLIGSLSSVLVERPALSLNEKAVNGDDADDAPGPTLFVGETANYTYKVQNTGNVELSGIVVIDDKGVAVTCPKTTLAPGELMTCTGTSTVVEGLHTNTAYATGNHPGGTVTSNTEVANYTGVKNEANLTINKTVINDNDGDKQPGDFKIYVNDIQVTPGQTKSYTPGIYEIKETAQAGYVLSTVSGDCFKGPNGRIYITLTTGQDAVCNLTNDDVPPALKLIKSVINDNGGTASAQSWSLSASGPSSFSGKSGVSSDATFKKGEYILSESGGPSGYTSKGWTCSNGVNVTDGNKINLPLGKQTECTVTNDDDTAAITLIKQLGATYGSTMPNTAWTLYAKDQAENTVLSGATGISGNVNAGSYNLSESFILGWESNGWNCGDFGSSNNGLISLSLNLGDSAACTITNSAIQPRIKVIKHVVDQYGGGKTASDFSMTVTGTNVTLTPGNTGTASSQTFSGSETGTYVYMDVGSYEVTETAIPGYTQTRSPDCSGTIDVGDIDRVCTITNTAQPPKLTVYKKVINDDGGTKRISDFKLYVDGRYVKSGTANDYNVGRHYISEKQLAGYKLTKVSGDCRISYGKIYVDLSLGDKATCTLHNDDIAPKLIVKKMVINDDGGYKTARDFRMIVYANRPYPHEFNGNKNGTPVKLKAGSYYVTEKADSGYEKSYKGDCSSEGKGRIGIGETKTCIVVNNDIAPTLTLVKHIEGDQYGDTATENDFGLRIDGKPVSSGQSVRLKAGKHTINEDGLPGYELARISGESPTNNNGSNHSEALRSLNSYGQGRHGAELTCPSELGGSIKLGVGDNKTCYIVNRAIQPKLTVIKKVVNDNGGTKSVSDFKLFVNQETVKSGEAKGLNVGQYTVSESADPNYKATFSGDCDAGGKVDLALGESKTCVITNDDIAPKLTLVKKVINNDGGTKKPSDWTLTALGPTGLTGAGEVTSGDDFKAGTYKLSESIIKGYTSLGWSCTNGIQVVGDQITIQNGQSTVCTVTNDDTPPILVNTGQDTIRTLLLGVGLLMIAFCSWFLVAETVRTKF